MKDAPHRGVTHWLDRSSPDGTTLDLLRFDFRANPALRLEIYDQDEDDTHPGDNQAAGYYPRGVGQVTRHLNERGRGPVVAAWNGLFFATDFGTGDPHGTARHVAPVVLRGQVRYNVGNYRWTFGVRSGGKPRFDVLHLPGRAGLQQFEFAAAGAQCLVREGKPLKLRPFPRPGEPRAKRPVPCPPDEAGHIPEVDHIRTSRTSMAWSRDGRRFYLLIVRDPNHEISSVMALRRREPDAGGWSVADLQQFWLAQGAWGAVNIDGGNATQMVYRRPDTRYEMVLPSGQSADLRRAFPPSFTGAPEGGVLMYFYVRDGS
jgi:hypothetical protein